ncbi:MAG: hypothetical protein AAGN15_03630 [Cyanobacteria bacterium J06581_3]
MKPRAEAGLSAQRLYLAMTVEKSLFSWSFSALDDRFRIGNLNKVRQLRLSGDRS